MNKTGSSLIVRLVVGSQLAIIVGVARLSQDWGLPAATIPYYSDIGGTPVRMLRKHELNRPVQRGHIKSLKTILKEKGFAQAVPSGTHPVFPFLSMTLWPSMCATAVQLTD